MSLLTNVNSTFAIVTVLILCVCLLSSITTSTQMFFLSVSFLPHMHIEDLVFHRVATIQSLWNYSSTLPWLFQTFPVMNYGASTLSRVVTRNEMHFISW